MKSMPTHPVMNPQRLPIPSVTKVKAEPLEGNSRANSLYWLAMKSATIKPTMKQKGIAAPTNPASAGVLKKIDAAGDITAIEMTMAWGSPSAFLRSELVVFCSVVTGAADEGG